MFAEHEEIAGLTWLRWWEETKDSGMIDISPQTTNACIQLRGSMIQWQEPCSLPPAIAITYGRDIASKKLTTTIMDIPDKYLI